MQRRRSSGLATIIGSALVVAFLAACGGSGDQKAAAGSPNASSASGGADLTGAGATFPYPIYSKWFADYAAKTGVKINYQSIGSGGGIRQLTEGTVDFGASDAPMSDEEHGESSRAPVLHVPTVLGAVVITYNVPGVTQPLKLDGDVIAEIFLGKITKWNDAARSPRSIPASSCPRTDILVVHRSDGSGTTYIFTDYLDGREPDVGQGARQRARRCSGPSASAARATRAWRARSSRRRARSAMSSWRMPSRTSCRTRRCKNAAGKFVDPTRRVGHGGGAGAAGEAAAQDGLPRLDRERARARPRIRSRRSRTCSSTRRTPMPRRARS